MRKHPIKILVFVVLVFFLTLAVNNQYYKDYQTTLLPGFYLQDSSSDLRAHNWSVPVVHDWNKDGRKDLLVGSSYVDKTRKNHGVISFYENTGSDTLPLFSGYTHVQTCAQGCTDVRVSAFG